MRTVLFFLLFLTVIVTSATSADFPPAPPTKTVNVIDTLHGVAIPDPYRWLENGDDPEVQQWSQQQYDYFRSYVDNFPDKELLQSEMTALLSTGSIGQPSVVGNHYFTWKRTGDQNHAVMFVREGLTGKDEVLVDPNQFSEDGTSAMDWYYLSQDGALLSYGVSHSGSEHTTLFIKDVRTRGMLLDTIPYTQYAAVAWLPDNSGFFYTRFPTPGSVPAGNENYYRKIYFHRLGQEWERDSLIYADSTSKTHWPSCDISPDGRWLGVVVFQGGGKSELYLRDLRDPNGSFTRLTEGKDARYNITMLNDRFLVTTTDGATRSRVMAGTYQAPTMANWYQIIPERNVVYNAIAVVANHIVINGTLNASSRLELFTLEGKEVKKLELPGIGTVASIGGEWNGHELFYYFYSFNHPPAVFRYDFGTGRTELFDQMSIPFALTDLELKQVWYNSKDGTPVSMFIVSKKGTKLDGSNPCVLDGYGGFNAMDTPVFNRRKVIWMLHGGLYALVNLRGNGEYGEQWHRGGMLENKQNTFDDFIAAAEYLISQGYTSSSRLSIYGGSNGGLTIGAVITQRPDLFAAAVCDVPLLDMIRYHKFRIGQLWAPEYGSSDDPEQFKYIFKYSPYQNVRKATAYPAVLFKAGESDGRVDPLHARKMAALMQSSSSSGRPVFVRVEGKAGHGQGKPISRVAEEVVEEWCFVYRALGLRVVR